jgi:AraC family transcriptional regulator
MRSTAPRGDVYARRINAVISHVRENLDGDLSLEALASVGCFSKFHFHRIFRSVTDETVSDMVVRLRLERAADLLRSVPRLSITAAAYEVGFSSVPVFSRAFRKRYGINARSWDRQSPLENSKNGQFADEFPRYTLDELQRFGFDVKLSSVPTQRLAYIRVHDSYSSFDRIKDAYYRLIEWYQLNGGSLSNVVLYGMSQDHPDVTPLKLCRFDWCIKVPSGWTAGGEVDVTDFPACRVAAVRCSGGLDEANRVIQYLFRCWLPRSRFQPANLPGMEIYRRLPDEMAWEEYDIDCAVPVIPL